MGLILSGKALMVMNGRGVIKTVSRTLPRPSIIRLDHMVHRPRPRIKLTRREVFRRDDYTCQYCGRHAPDLTVDHILPKHLGGQHIWTNVVAACAYCNHRKGGRTLEESHMTLLKIPKEPPANARYIFGRHLTENGEWKTFIEGW
jgi:5-methylcytosine-specific restriction endonuclease McrA